MAATPAAANRRSAAWLRRLAIALGSAVINRPQILLKMSRSIEDESVFAVRVGRLLALGLTGGAVDAVETSKQDGRRIVGIGVTVVGARQLLLRHRAHHIRRHDHHQLGLVVDVVAALAK